MVCVEDMAHAEWVWAQIDQIDARIAHVKDGCFVYVGMGWDADGKPEYYLWGPWP